MPLDGAAKQAAYRQRQRDKLKRQTGALNDILKALDGNDKPLAVKLRDIAKGGLA